jgi:hypothetical protein
MAPVLPATHHGRVPRLLVFWTRPQHLSAEEADAWTSEQLSGLQDLEAVERARLTRLGTPSTAHPQEWDWMLELDLAPGADARRCVESGWCGEWLADLQLLGMRPAAVLADDGRALPAEDG